MRRTIDSFPTPIIQAPVRAERRAMRRVPVESCFAVARIVDGERIEAPAELLAADITPCGIGLRSACPFQPGDRAVIRMFSTEGKPSLIGLTIVHAAQDAPGCYRVGARFTVLPRNIVRRALTLGNGPFNVFRAAG